MIGKRAVQFSLAIVVWISATKSAVCQTSSGADKHQTDQACYPIDQIINTLAKNVSRTKNTNPESAIITAIRRRTVCSWPTEDELGKIRNAGGSERLIDALEAASPSPTISGPCPQPEVITPKQGRLTVTCESFDCSVFIDGVAVGTTTNKVLTKTLPEGPVIVSVGAKNYEPDRQQEIVDIKNGEAKLISFRLAASRAALEEAGAKLFQGIIAALGGEEGLKLSQSVRGKGTLTSFRDGKPTLWDLAALIKLPDKGRFKIGPFKGAQSYEIVQSAGEMELIKMGKGAELDDLSLALNQLQEYQLTKVINRLQSSSFRMVAADLNPIRGEGIVLAAEEGVEKYLIRLDATFRPQEITLEAGGLDKGTRVLYSDYSQQGIALYPKRMQVQRPGATSNGIEVRLDTVEMSPPDVLDADFAGKQGKH